MSYNNYQAIFKAEKLIPVIEEAIRNHCDIFLVKDHGLYMMSDEGLSDNTGCRQTVCYAEGFNPETDDWYDNLYCLCGGDDFAERIEPDDVVISSILTHKYDVAVSFTEDTFIIERVTNEK